MTLEKVNIIQEASKRGGKFSHQNFLPPSPSPEEVFTSPSKPSLTAGIVLLPTNNTIVLSKIRNQRGLLVLKGLHKALIQTLSKIGCFLTCDFGSGGQAGVFHIRRISDCKRCVDELGFGLVDAQEVVSEDPGISRRLLHREGFDERRALVACGPDDEPSGDPAVFLRV